MSDPLFRRRLRRLLRVKFTEIRDGCNDCRNEDCLRHDRLIIDMILHPARYERSLALPGDLIHPDERQGETP